MKLLITINKLEMIVVLETKVRNENYKNVRKNSFGD